MLTVLLILEKLLIFLNLDESSSTFRSAASSNLFKEASFKEALFKGLMDKPEFFTSMDKYFSADILPWIKSFTKIEQFSLALFLMASLTFYFFMRLYYKSVKALIVFILKWTFATVICYIVWTTCTLHHDKIQTFMNKLF